MNEDAFEASRAPLLAHLMELRKRFVYAVLAWLGGFIFCYFFVEHIYHFLSVPLAQAFADEPSRRLIYTGLAETFLSYIKLSAYAGLFVAFPIIAAQVYLFIAPGLYRHEKRALIPYLLGAPLLFTAGIALAYYFVMPMAWKFFVGFEAPAVAGGLPLQLEAKLSEYISLVLQIMMAFGLAFQLPILLTLLVRAGLLQTVTLQRGRRYAVVILLTVAAVLTPPDILSQIGLFIPLYLLYEISLLLCAQIESAREKNANQPTESPTHA